MSLNQEITRLRQQYGFVAEFLTMREVALVLGVPYRSIESLRHRGQFQLPVTFIGLRPRVSISAMAQFTLGQAFVVPRSVARELSKDSPSDKQAVGAKKPARARKGKDDPARMAKQILMDQIQKAFEERSGGGQ